MDNGLSHRKIVIIGGGFGGVRAALDLAKQNLKAKITLITDKPYLEYYAALYRVVAGHSPMEACIPYRDIFAKKNVEVIVDRVIEADLIAKTLKSESGFTYRFDTLVIAVGAETAYFNIPGMQELSYGMRTANEALALKRHLHEAFEDARKYPSEEKVTSAHVVIVGAGASGVELAGELATYARDMAHKHGLSRSFVSIDLIEAMPRVLPLLSEDVSEKVLKRLRLLGVNVLVNRSVVKEEMETIYLKDMQMKTKTVIWTAGLKANSLLQSIKSITFDKRGRVEVDECLQAAGHDEIYVIGDAAATKYSGMAQTAVRDGMYVAEVIGRKMRGKPYYKSESKLPVYAVPVGKNWAVVVFGTWKVYGRTGWWLRRAADMKVFLSLLPLRKALVAFLNGNALVETCPICCGEECAC